MVSSEVDRALRAMPLKDLRILCRARGLTPAGGKDQLEDRIKEHMMATGNYSLQLPADGGAPMDGQAVVAPQGYQQYTTGVNNNNYSRPGGQQNVGNFITDRRSSHVMAPPGGKSSIQLGGYPEPAAPPAAYQQTPPPAYHQGPPPGHYASPDPYAQAQQAHAYGASSSDMRGGSLANQYSRPGGQQNVGNFITDRPSSKVLAPPGGASQVSFGDYSAPPAAAYPARGAPYGSPAPAPYGTSPSPGYGGGYGGQPGAAPTYDANGRPITAGARSNEAAQGRLANQYSRPGGQQNVGNFITDRPSSKVLAPPGGRSQISFG